MTSSHQMRAAQIQQFNSKYELCEVVVPKCGPNSLLIQVYAAGFCHSDLQVLQGQFPAELPMIPSHEPAGKIVEVGSNVQGDWKVGDRVGVLNFKDACSECSGCRQQKGRFGKLDPRFCEKRKMAGFKHDGAFAQFMLADPETTLRLPKGVSYEQGAPLMCAGATAWGALSKLKPDVRPGDTVGVIGVGGVGHLALQLAKAVGYRTVAIDARTTGCDLASEVPESLRPDLVIDLSKGDGDKLVQDFTNGEGLAGIVVCTDAPKANAWGLRQLGNKGVMVPLGLPKDGFQFDAETIIFRELTIRGSYVAGAEDVAEMLRVADDYNISSHLTILDFHEILNVVDRYLDASIKGRLVIQVAKE